MEIAEDPGHSVLKYQGLFYTIIFTNMRVRGEGPCPIKKYRYRQSKNHNFQIVVVVYTLSFSGSARPGKIAPRYEILPILVQSQRTLTTE